MDLPSSSKGDLLDLAVGLAIVEMRGKPLSSLIETTGLSLPDWFMDPDRIVRVKKISGCGHRETLTKALRETQQHNSILRLENWMNQHRLEEYFIPATTEYIDGACWTASKNQNHIPILFANKFSQVHNVPSSEVTDNWNTLKKVLTMYNIHRAVLVQVIIPTSADSKTTASCFIKLNISNIVRYLPT
jgi:hypothetical protein